MGKITLEVPTELLDEHMLILEAAFFENLMRDHDNCEYGGIGLDDKRPFGNSGVQTDILEMIDAPFIEEGYYTDEQVEYADRLYNNLIPWLQERYKKWKTLGT